MQTGLPAERAAFYYNRFLLAHHDAAGNYRNAVRDFRIHFEQLFKDLTAGEDRLFSTVFQRSVYVADALDLPQHIRDDMHGFRKFANRVTHETEVICSDDEYQKALGALCRLVFQLSGETIPDELKNIYRTDHSYTPEFPAGTPREKLDFVRVTITKVGEMQETAKGTRLFFLQAIDEKNERELRIGLRDFQSYAYSSYQLLFKPYRIAHFTQLESGEKPGIFFCTLDSLIVIEPDFLIDVTEVAECFQQNSREPRLFLLSKFTHSDPNVRALAGKMVNDLMDVLLENPQADVDDCLDEIIRQNALRSASFGSEVISKLREEIKTGFLPVVQEQVKKLNRNELRIEPAFFSAKYGLQGRLDVLEEPPGEPDVKKVFELKSGKAPSVIQTADGSVLHGGPRENVWSNHRMQVIAYHMLLRSAFGEQTRGKGAIFYPIDPHFPLREIVGAPQAERELLEVRNTIVYYLLELAEGRTSVLNELMPGRMRALPPFKQTDAETIEYLIKQAGAESLSYFKEIAGFVVRELHAAKTGGNVSDPDRSGNGFASLWLDEPAVKEARFNLLRGLKLEKFDPETATVHFSIHNSPPHNFREGDIGILYEWKEGKSPLDNQMLRGTITRLTSTEVSISLKSRQSDLERFKQQEWAIEHDLYETGYWGLLQGLFYFLQADLRKRRLLLGMDSPQTETINWAGDAELLPNQEDIIRKALEAKEYFLIQGPPGTGKTSKILMRILSETIQKTGENIVVLAYTNRAVREIAKKMTQQGLPFELLSKGEDDEHGGLQKPGETLPELEKRIKSTRIFLSTVTSFQSRAGDILKLALPTTIIIDEASQLVEAQLAGVLVRFKKWILIGDQKQLPAVVQQQESQTVIDDPNLKKLGFSDLRQSLFERLYRNAEERKWTHAFGMLENHYRMHEDIAALINHHYRGKLKPGLMEQQAAMQFPPDSTVLSGLLGRSRTLFIPSDRMETGRTHPQEAKRIVSWLTYLRKFYFKDGFLDNEGNAKVGVISPFRAQIAAIRDLAGEKLLEGVTVDTVERFQGSERDIILVSLAVNDVRQMNALQAVDAGGETDRKLLVAISRARSHLVMLGYAPALSQNPHYGDLLSRIQKSGGMIEPDALLRAALDGV